jgi:hypothetical protein
MDNGFKINVEIRGDSVKVGYDLSSDKQALLSIRLRFTVCVRAAHRAIT